MNVRDTGLIKKMDYGVSLDAAAQRLADAMLACFLCGLPAPYHGPGGSMTCKACRWPVAESKWGIPRFGATP